MAFRCTKCEIHELFVFFFSKNVWRERELHTLVMLSIIYAAKRFSCYWSQLYLMAAYTCTIIFELQIHTINLSHHFAAKYNVCLLFVFFFFFFIFLNICFFILSVVLLLLAVVLLLFVFRICFMLGCLSMKKKTVFFFSFIRLINWRFQLHSNYSIVHFS